MASDELGAEQRLRVHLEQRRQAHRRAVGEQERARIPSCLVVVVVRGDLERLAYSPARITRRALEVAQRASAPRSLDEVIVQRPQQSGRESRSCRTIAAQQRLSLGFARGHLVPLRKSWQYAMAVYVKT